MSRIFSSPFNTFAGRVNAIRGVDFELRRGETIAIVGESGSGKSVTVKSILGIRSKNEIVDRGEILFTYRAENGEDRTENLLKLSDRDMQKRIRGRHIALVFQDPLTSLNPTMTIGAQIAESVIKRRKASHAEAKKRTIELLEEVGIPNAAERYNNYPHQSVRRDAAAGGHCHRAGPRTRSAHLRRAYYRAGRDGSGQKFWT